MGERTGHYTQSELHSQRNDRIDFENGLRGGKFKRSDHPGHQKYFGGIDLPKKKKQDE